MYVPFHVSKSVLNWLKSMWAVSSWSYKTKFHKWKKVRRPFLVWQRSVMPVSFMHGYFSGPISQIPKCMRQISHNAPFCNIKVHTCAHFFYKMVHCGIWDWCIVRYGTGASWDCGFGLFADYEWGRSKINTIKPICYNKSNVLVVSPEQDKLWVLYMYSIMMCLRAGVWG